MVILLCSKFEFGYSFFAFNSQIGLHVVAVVSMLHAFCSLVKWTSTKAVKYWRHSLQMSLWWQRKLSLQYKMIRNQRRKCLPTTKSDTLPNRTYSKCM